MQERPMNTPNPQPHSKDRYHLCGKTSQTEEIGY